MRQKKKIQKNGNIDLQGFFPKKGDNKMAEDPLKIFERLDPKLSVIYLNIKRS
jgi:hypothetical protein